MLIVIYYFFPYPSKKIMQKLYSQIQKSQIHKGGWVSESDLLYNIFNSNFGGFSTRRIAQKLWNKHIIINFNQWSNRYFEFPFWYANHQLKTLFLKKRILLTCALAHLTGKHLLTYEFRQIIERHISKNKQKLEIFQSALIFQWFLESPW